MKNARAPTRSSAVEDITLDGIALIHALHHLNPDVRVIAASGMGANGSLARASGEGVKNFLPKPYTAEAILRLVRQVLDAKEDREED